MSPVISSLIGASLFPTQGKPSLVWATTRLFQQGDKVC